MPKRALLRSVHDATGSASVIGKPVKVFGERNCGTNVAQLILRDQYGLQVLPAGAPKWLWRAASNLGSRGERILDLWDDLNRSRTLGWKHAYVDAYTESMMEERAVMGVALVKHPLSWYASMQRHPYHLVGTEHGLEHLAIRRERLPHRVDTLFDLWSLKTARYVALEDAKLVSIVRFEDFIDDAARALRAAVEHLRLQDHSSDVAIPAMSVKRDGRSSESIRAYYREERWRNELPPDSDQLMERVPADLLDRLDYR